MGLDVSHECWHGPYSAFSRWRHAVARAAGYVVWKVCYDDGAVSLTPMLDWGHITQENLEGEWKTPQLDPLVYLLAHSDCDGVIHPAEASPLSDRLERLLPEIPQDLHDKTRSFIDGLRAAVKAGEDVEFH